MEEDEAHFTDVKMFPNTNGNDEDEGWGRREEEGSNPPTRCTCCLGQKPHSWCHTCVRGTRPHRSCPAQGDQEEALTGGDREEALSGGDQEEALSGGVRKRLRQEWIRKRTPTKHDDMTIISTGSGPMGSQERDKDQWEDRDWEIDQPESCSLHLSWQLPPHKLV